MSENIKYAVGDFDSRPWGRWEVLSVGEGFIIKKIDVNPGAKLSLQSHEHRSEHWTIICGQAAVTRDEEVFELKTDGYVFIPARAKHRIENIGNTPMSFVEIQVGEVLDEKDITRYEDSYGRV